MLSLKPYTSLSCCAFIYPPRMSLYETVLFASQDDRPREALNSSELAELISVFYILLF